MPEQVEVETDHALKFYILHIENWACTLYCDAVEPFLLLLLRLSAVRCLKVAILYLEARKYAAFMYVKMLIEATFMSLIANLVQRETKENITNNMEVESSEKSLDTVLVKNVPAKDHGKGNRSLHTVLVKNAPAKGPIEKEIGA